MNNEKYVYFISDGNAVKIGTSDDPIRRLRDLQTGNPRLLDLLGISRLQTESEFHEIFKDYHLRGEWYELNKKILDYCENLEIKISFGKNLKITEETHQKLDIIRARNEKLKTFEDVIKMLLEDYKF